MATRGFRRKHSLGASDRTPPGQYVTDDFPVLSARGLPPRTSLDTWTFALEVAPGRELHRWTWNELRSLPASQVTVDIHCVTKWSKLDTRWKGVSFDTLLREAGLEPPTPYVMALCDGGYTTNLSVADLRADLRLRDHHGHRGLRWLRPGVAGRCAPPLHASDGGGASVRGL